MKVVITLLFFLFTLPYMLSAQETGNIPVAQSAGGGQYGALYANLVNKKKSDHHSTIGSPFLYEEWMPAEINVLGKSTTFEQVKVDVMNNYLEIMVNGAEKILDLKYINSFELYPATPMSQYFVNAAAYKYDGKIITGFMQKVRAGDFTVLKRYKARIVKPDMNDKIVGADPRDKFVHSSEIYVQMNDRLHQIKKKKDLLELLKNKEKKMKVWFKENKVNVKELEDIRKALEYYQE